MFVVRYDINEKEPTLDSKLCISNHFTYVEKCRRGVDGSLWRRIFRRMMRSIGTVVKITLICLNLWVLAVVLVVCLGHWRVFETVDSSSMYDNSHLVVMRELKEDTDRKLPIIAMSVTNISEVESYYVPPESDSIFSLDKLDKAVESDSGKSKGGGGDKSAANKKQAAPKNIGKRSAPPVANPQPPAPPKPKAPAAPASPAANPSPSKEDSKLKNLQHWCQQQHSKKTSYDKIPASKLNYIVYDEKHKLLFCQIPGAALNEWRKILLITTKVVDTSAPSAIAGGDVFGKYGKSLKKLSDIPDASKRASILSSYYKVLFVRDPLERLLMTYKTKFKAASSKYFHHTFGTQIIKKYRKGASEADIKAGSSVKFSEFVKYIVDVEHEGKVNLNEHWQQYYKQCHPCVVDYNFIGTFENVEADTRAVLKTIKADREVKPPYVNNRQTLSEKELTAAYKEVDILTLKNLYKVYLADYTLFGYKCPSFLHDMLEKADTFHDY
ncbi:carbohydrate sulfotransferase [Plakobranchus ocellatus]|uniref:Carbohydrate sulfotransferase n=1 Tax=Plakobranchus ocellatus TaxID=259542 RepID=A0AAV4DWF4_9GAST|nr:carbohydrate sulfotransferase [Plakobranchus ocellatus]